MSVRCLPFTLAVAFLLALLLGSTELLAETKEAHAMLDAEAIHRRIRQHRTADVTLTVTDAAGKALADTEVTVRMVRHKFLFGCNIFALRPSSTAKDDQAYGERFSELLNFATLPFYWRGYERSEGKTDAERVAKMARWCQEHGIRTKGHPLVWTLEPDWVAGKPAAEAEQLLSQRITREVEHFRGLIDTWDVLNEAVVGPDQARRRNALTVLALYEREGRDAVIKQAFATARKAGPHATLVLNDFRTDEAYEKLIESALAAGVPIDRIGIQSHMHGGYWGAEKAWEVCERFARFGKPLHFTELTILSGEAVGEINWENRRGNRWTTSPELEERQARQAAQFYSVLFSHPAVEAITWWDLSDAASWMGAPAGLIRKDMTPKPAYLALHKLIRGEPTSPAVAGATSPREGGWWTGPLRLKTDGTGTLSFRGFLGEYVVETGEAQVALQLPSAGKQDLTVELTSKP